MKKLIIYLKPTGPFHLQSGGEDHESIAYYPESDMLSSAVMYWWFRQFDTIKGFPEKLPFQFSSTFPAVLDKNGCKKLYPKPPDIDIDPDTHNHKVFKKIKWIDQTLFNRWQTGDDLSEAIPKDSESKFLKRGGAVWVSKDHNNFNNRPLLKSHARTRVTLDRINSASTPFHFVTAHYAPDTLLWFFADVKPAREDKLMTLLRLLGDEGIGADKTVGMGSFKIHAIEQQANESSDTEKWFNMGIYNPEPKYADTTINWLESYYQLTQRGGWVSGTTLRRKPVPTVQSNALLVSPKKPVGSIRCVLDKDDENIPKDNRPDYSVYRDCRGYFLPC